MKEHQKNIINKFLNKLYGDLSFESPPESYLIWRNGRKCSAMIYENTHILLLLTSDFEYFVDMFSLPWERDEDDPQLLELIIPHLKFNDGTPAIPELIKSGLIKELTKIVCYPYL